MSTLTIQNHTELINFREHLSSYECNKCTLGETCREQALYPVVSRGHGRVMLIGKHPAANEHKTQVPLTGYPGSVLEDNLWKYTALDDESDCYITNINKCFPTEDTKIRKDEQEACKTYLYEEIELVNPEIIVFLGKDVYTDIGDKNSFPGYSTPFEVMLHGKVYQSIVIYNPAMVLRDPSKRKELRPHFVITARMLKEHTDFYEDNEEYERIQQYVETDFVDREYRLIQTDEQLKTMLKELAQHQKVAIDTETTSLDTWRDDFQLVGISLAGDRDTGYYIPVNHENDPTSLESIIEPKPQQVTAENAIATTRWLYDHDIHLVFFNYPYDWRVFRRYDLDIDLLLENDDIFQVKRWVHDAQIMTYLDDENDSHSLKKQTELRFHTKPMDFDEASGGENFMYADLEKATEYAADDAINTLAIMEHATKNVKQQIRKFGTPEILTHVYPVEIQTARIMAEAQEYGMVVDEEAWRKLNHQVTSDLKRHLETLDNMCNWVNHSSPTQIRTMLEQLFEDPVININALEKLARKELHTPFLDVFTDKYGESRDSGHLKMLVEFYKKEHAKNGTLGRWEPEKLADYVKVLLDYRLAAKIKASYIDAIERYAMYHNGLWIIHGGVNTIGTTSGRMSMNNPNLQNLPRDAKKYDVRSLFIPRPGKAFTLADWDSMEMVVAAAVFGDTTIQEILKRKMADPDDPYGDMHRVTASEIYNVSPENVTNDQRQATKKVNFGSVYGISKYGLAAQLTESTGRDYTSDEGQEMLDAFFRKYFGLKQGFEENEKFVRSNGYLVNLSGRIRHVGSNPTSGQVRSAINFLIQGTCAQIMKECLTKSRTRLQQRKDQAWISTVIHDEIVIEHDLGYGEYYGNMLQEVMTRPIKGKLEVMLTATPDLEWPSLSKSNG